MEVLKHYFGITHNNELIAQGIKIRRHDVLNFITQFHTELLCTLFDCNCNAAEHCKRCIDYSSDCVDTIQTDQTKTCILTFSQ